MSAPLKTINWVVAKIPTTCTRHRRPSLVLHEPIYTHPSMLPPSCIAIWRTKINLNVSFARLSPLLHAEVVPYKRKCGLLKTKLLGLVATSALKDSSSSSSSSASKIQVLSNASTLTILGKLKSLESCVLPRKAYNSLSSLSPSYTPLSCTSLSQSIIVLHWQKVQWAT